MADYHVGCGAFGIYAGRLNKDKTMWIGSARTEVTDEAICAVRDYLLMQIEIGKSPSNSFGYEWTMEDGKTVQLAVTIKESESNMDGGEPK